MTTPALLALEFMPDIFGAPDSAAYKRSMDKLLSWYDTYYKTIRLALEGGATYPHNCPHCDVIDQRRRIGELIRNNFLEDAATRENAIHPLSTGTSSTITLPRAEVDIVKSALSRAYEWLDYQAAKRDVSEALSILERAMEGK